MKKSVLLLVAVFALSLLMGSGAMADAVVVENPESKTGYTVKFDYVDDKAVNVQIMGGFQFSLASDPNTYANGINLAEGDSAANYYVDPEDWSADANLWHINDSSYVRDMTKVDGVWTYELDLTGGVYVYQYKVLYEGAEKYVSIIDPTNIPLCNEMGANQNRSQFFVPYNAEKQAPQDDWTYCFPAENEADRGTFIHEYYTGLFGEQRPVEIWLPASYDAERAEPYKVLYMSHGGGGEEGDWFYQGNAGNILDRLVAEGVCEPFILVAMNNTTLGWDYNKINNNLKSYLIPYLEENYNISKEPKDRAFTGLSMGGMTTSTLYFYDPLYFGYFGILSGCNSGAFPEIADYSAYKVPQLFLAGGWGDFGLDGKRGEDGKVTSAFALSALTDKFDAVGITYNNGGEVLAVEGSHDWFVWPQMMKVYFTEYLWK